jgi:hypothetical protein
MEENGFMLYSIWNIRNSVKSKEDFPAGFQSYETRTIKIGPASEGKSEIKSTYTNYSFTHKVFPNVENIVLFLNLF